MTFRVTLPCTQAEAVALAGDIPQFALLDEPPVLVSTEVEGEGWRLDAYFETRPRKADLSRLKALVPSAALATAAVERVGEEDWLSVSQQGLAPIRAGRFFVHTPAHRGEAPADAITFEIDAGRAFGTGHHETTAGCLEALDRLKRQGASFADIADVGTGTGLLAFAALRLWPAARAIASDIDPVAIDVTAENAAINGIRIGRARGQLELAVASGLDHARLKARAPYDLIIANILAGPLIALASDFSAALAPGGRLILAGLLDRQAEAVLAAGRRVGMMSVEGVARGEWPTLVMRKRRRTERRRRSKAPSPSARSS